MKLSMQVEERTIFKRIDFNFIIVILVLNIVGLINLYSAAHGVHSTGLSRAFVAQMLWLLGGWFVFFLVTFIDYQFFKRICYFIYGLNVAALVAVMFVGKTYYGAQRWLDFGFFRYQPSETMKFVLVLVLARILSQHIKNRELHLKDLFLPFMIILVPFALTVKQPDLGTGLTLLAIGITMIMFVGVNRKILIGATVILLTATPIIWSLGLKEYQKNRILNFIDPGRDPRGSGYNSIQSKIAVGSGKIVGKGFRKGTQSQLEFLPERHTDFIYSVLSEEHGFIGSMTTLGLFTILFVMGIGIASQARDKLGALMVVGSLSIIFWHMFVNIGMVIGLLPIVGVPLPLLSYGGSIMITTMTALGLISSVAYRKYLF